MPPEKKPKSNERTVLCPECDTETVLTRNEDGEDEGRCPGCNLNVGRIFTKRRYDKALKKVEEGENEEQKKTEKKKSGSDWF